MFVKISVFKVSCGDFYQSVKILKKCDEILVMDNGQVLETGTFDYLISNNEYFKNLYYYNQEL